MRFDSAAGSIVGESRFAVSIVEEDDIQGRGSVMVKDQKERRVFKVNEPNLGPIKKLGFISATGEKYGDNKVITSKYNFFTFLP